MVAAPKPLMPLDEAWTRLQEAVQAHLGDSAGGHGGRRTESIDSLDALGRVLAADVVSPVHVPPLDNSAMDGYAVRCADVQAGAVLPVSQRIAAGQSGAPLTALSCARIFTGAPVPGGADAVVMQEHTQATPEGVLFSSTPRVGQNIRRQGEDIACGQTVLTQGLRLGPAALGVAASVGAASLTVSGRPRVALLTTGNELVMPGHALPHGAIYNSNRHTLRGLLQACGAECVDMGIVADDPLATREVLRAAAHCDLILSSGGVSVGEEDHLKAAVQAEGELAFWQLAIKPGKPFVFGRLRRTAPGSVGHALFMGLPGNPVASYVTFLLLVRPVLGLLSGEAWALPQATAMPADFDWPAADKRREFLRARRSADGRVTLYPHQGSGVLSSAVWADGLVDLAAGQTVRRGDRVPFLPLHECVQPAQTQLQPHS